MSQHAGHAFGMEPMENVQFKRSTRCESHQCVEVGMSGGVLMRDSKQHDGPVLRFSQAAWRRFIAETKI